MTVKVIIAGGRDFADYDHLCNVVKDTLVPLNPFGIEIISGGAKGVDKYGEVYAKENNIPLEVHKADWTNNGKRAGMIRNREMAEVADVLIVFWDGTSKGTKNMISEALSAGLEIHIFRY